MRPKQGPLLRATQHARSDHATRNAKSFAIDSIRGPKANKWQMQRSGQNGNNTIRAGSFRPQKNNSAPDGQLFDDETSPPTKFRQPSELA
jgi:hypothetical protein